MFIQNCRFSAGHLTVLYPAMDMGWVLAIDAAIPKRKCRANNRVGNTPVWLGLVRIYSPKRIESPIPRYHPVTLRPAYPLFSGIRIAE